MLAGSSPGTSQIEKFQLQMSVNSSNPPWKKEPKYRSRDFFLGGGGAGVSICLIYLQNSKSFGKGTIGRIIFSMTFWVVLYDQKKIKGGEEN